MTAVPVLRPLWMYYVRLLFSHMFPRRLSRHRALSFASPGRTLGVDASRGSSSSPMGARYTKCNTNRSKVDQVRLIGTNFFKLVTRRSITKPSSVRAIARSRDRALERSSDRAIAFLDNYTWTKHDSSRRASLDKFPTPSDVDKLEVVFLTRIAPSNSSDTFHKS